MKKIISLLVILSFLFPSIIFANNDFKEINLWKFETIDSFKYSFDGSNYWFIWGVRLDAFSWIKKNLKEKNWNNIDWKIQKIYYTKSWKLIYTEYKHPNTNLVIDWKEYILSANKSSFEWIDFLENKEDFLYKASDDLSWLQQIIKNNETNYLSWEVRNFKTSWNNYWYTLYNSNNSTYNTNNSTYKIIFNWKEVYSLKANWEVPEIYLSKYTNNYAIYTNEWEKHFIDINWERKEIKSWIWKFVFSDFWNHYIYTIFAEWGNQKVIIDWKENSNLYEYIRDIAFSKDWNKFVYTWKKDWKFFISNNWNEKFISDEISEIGILNNWNNIIYLKKMSDDKWSLIENWVDTKISNWNSINLFYFWDKWSPVHNIYYSNDFKKYIFIGKKDWKETLYINWKFINNTYDKIEILNISKTLNNYSFIWIKWNKKFLVLNDKEIDISNYYDNLIWENWKQIFVSDDWNKVWIIYKNSNWESILLELDNSNTESNTQTAPIQETPKIIKANTQLDKALKPFFEKNDKKWDKIAQKTYKTLISKIDILLKKRLSVKNKNTLNYLKDKVQEKIK